MAYIPAERNYDGIEYEAYRRVIDPKFNELHDELCVCYYDYWKKGNSKPFQGYDVGKDEKESKEIFDKLHGLIAHEHALALKSYHDALPEVSRIVKFQINMCDSKVDPVTEEIEKSVCEQCVDKKAALSLEGYSISVTAVAEEDK